MEGCSTAATSLSGDGDEKTRVTAIVQKPPGAAGPGGGDCLVVIYTKEPTLLGKRFVLDMSPLRIGRGPENHIVLEGDSVSRRHVHFEQRSSTWYAVDDGSTNGTYVNDDQIARECALANGDRVKIGPTIFKYLSGTDVESQYHEEIYRMTIIDGLTQAHVKRYLLESLEKEIIRARRHQRDMCLVMFDIDHFKRINDTFGHLAGDYVLSRLSQVAQGTLRTEDLFARYGGEEFALLLPETTIEGAAQLAHDIRARVEENRFVFQNEHIPVTISMGVAKLLDTHKSGLDLIRDSDERLYEAKRTGRNRVVVAQ